MIKTINNPVILIDGSYYMHRAYNAYPSLTTSYGEPVRVIYGVINMIKNLLIRYQPTDIAIVFDTPGKTFRNDLFSQYKANRIKAPNDLYIQAHSLYKIIEAMGLMVLNIPKVEADDVIGTLATFYAQSGRTVLISTGDKDINQIVSSNIFIINTMSNIIFGPGEIEKKFGIHPKLMIDYLSLTGDRSDNIPGVPGIGPKTAQILLTKIGNLTKLYCNLEKINTIGLRNANKIQDILKINKETAFLSYKLATIDTNVTLNDLQYQLSVKPINIDVLKLWFKKYEFNNWLLELQSNIWINKYQNNSNTLLVQQNHNNNLSQLTKKISNNNIDTKKTIDVVYNIDSLRHWVTKIQKSKSITFNINTENLSNTSVNTTTNISNISLLIFDNINIYIPIHTNTKKHEHDNDKKLLSLQTVLLTLKPILENPKIKKISQNLKFNYTLFQKYNINLAGIIFDVTLELYILYGTSNYQDIKNFLDQETFNILVNFKKDWNNHNNNNKTSISHSIQTQSIYASKLTHSTYNLHHVLWSKICKNKKLKKILETIEIPLTSVLSRIENYGVLIDKNLLETYSIELNHRLHNLEKQAHKLTGTSFNLSSTKQLQEILYNQQNLPILQKTPRGAASTNESVLKKLSKKHPISNIILQYRNLSKLKCTYTNKLICMINEKSNRIHTSYNQTRTSTGRLSSNNPNLQNIPNHNHDGKKIRQAFIAPKKFLIVSADYSQIELRIIAHLSHDTKLINDFLSEKDIHTTTASEIFVTKLHLVTNEQRHQAKIINFGLMYGMSTFGLAKQLSITQKEAQKYIDRYFKRYPGVMQYMQQIKENANKYGYVSTLNGRKLYLPNIYSTNIFQKKSAERLATNAPIQGTASDIIKKAMISIDNWLQQNTIPAYMIMQVHDELVFEVQNNIINFFIKNIKKLMEECYTLDVPLKVDIGIGKNWAQAH